MRGLDSSRPVFVLARKLILLLTALCHSSSRESALVVEAHGKTTPETVIRRAFENIAYGERWEGAIRVDRRMSKNLADLQLTHLSSIGVREQPSSFAQPIL